MAKADKIKFGNIIITIDEDVKVLLEDLNNNVLKIAAFGSDAMQILAQISTNLGPVVGALMDKIKSEPDIANDPRLWPSGVGVREWLHRNPEADWATRTHPRDGDVYVRMTPAMFTRFQEWYDRTPGGKL